MTCFSKMKLPALVFIAMLFLFAGHVLGLTAVQGVTDIAVDGYFATAFVVMSCVALFLLCCVWAAASMAFTNPEGPWEGQGVKWLIGALVLYIVVYFVWWGLLLQMLLFMFYLFVSSRCTDVAAGLDTEIWSVCAQGIVAAVMLGPELLMLCGCWVLRSKHIYSRSENVPGINVRHPRAQLYESLIVS